MSRKSKGLFTWNVTLPHHRQSLTLCLWVTGWMGCTPNLPVKVPITIGKMLNFDNDGHRDGYVTCEQALIGKRNHF